MTHSETILRSWGLMRSYQNHKDELHDLALRFYVTLCHLNRGLGAIPFEKYQQKFAKFLENHSLFRMKIMQREKPHIPPHMYQALSEHLACYVIEQYWSTIASYPC